MRIPLRDERGGILVMAAVMIPVFLLLTALVVDVGNWYTHKRQLQNRADAGAFAAGVEYARNWKACVQTADPLLRASTAAEIADAARQYAGDPEATDYAGAILPAERNTEIANQANLDVVINSNNPDYNDDTDYTDGGGVFPNGVGNPCYLHPAADDISEPGHWTDVRVKERDLPSLFGPVGLPLSRNGARARIEIRPALSGHRFLPLAIPDNVVTRVQVRYYDECRDPGHASPLGGPQDLAPIPQATPDAWGSLGGGTLWGLPTVPGDLSEGDPGRGFTITVPAHDPIDCGSRPYLPVSVEVRLASRDEVNLNGSCQSLIDAKFADCFASLSQIRVWDDGNPAAHPLIKNVKLLGGCSSRADAYFGAYEGPEDKFARTCPYGATVEVDFGARAGTASNFHVRVNGVELVAPGGSPTGVWTTAGTPLVATTYKSGSQERGDNNVRVELQWKPPTGSAQTYAEDAHRAYVGTFDTAGAVDLVRTSLQSFAADLPGPEFDNLIDGGVTRTLFPTVGIRSVLKPGVLKVLRTEDSQGSQLVQCDPAVSSGQEFTLFEDGCEPWFTENKFNDPNWWNSASKECPDSNLWFKTNASPPYDNSSTNPWQCVLQAPGSSVGQTGDWMAVATQNCAEEDILNNKCKTIKPAAQANCGNYDGKPGEPMGWLQRGGDSEDPRVISLFVVPYQSLKSVSGSKAEIPLLGFANFYVMNWKGQNPSGKEDDPCPDPDFGGVTYSAPGKGTITGVFVEAVDYEPGPVDPTATCKEGDLTPCRVTLVR